MNPGPYSTCSRSPRITFVWRSFTFCTTVVMPGQRLANSRQNAREPGNSRPFVTSVTSISPLVCPTRTTAWRRKPLCVSSR